MCSKVGIWGRKRIEKWNPPNKQNIYANDKSRKVGIKDWQEKDGLFLAKITNYPNGKENEILVFPYSINNIHLQVEYWIKGHGSKKKFF